MFYIHAIYIMSILVFASATDYCVKDLCSGNRKHIACNNNGKFSSKCSSNAQMIDLKPHIKSIVNQHNIKRNQLASGNLPGYSPAKRMATMQWDNELAALAGYNVKQCHMEHDQCHNTKQFRYSGQNLGYFSHTGKMNAYTNSWLIEHNIQAWWNEYKFCKMAYIKKYPSNYSGPMIGHFTVMASDRNTHVGCAAIHYDEGSYHTFLVACNYGTTNLIDANIYATGKTGAGCKTGRNANLTSLCSTKESYTLDEAFE